MTPTKWHHAKMQEIERKYLVFGDEFRNEVCRTMHLAQGYICSRRVTARVRISDNEAFLTFKGKSRDKGLSRFEWERQIPLGVAKHLLARCRGVVEKYRHIVEYEGYTFEVDEFLGENRGLIVAEVELSSTTEQPPLPQWCGEEVTSNPCLRNSFLAKKPFKQWKKN